MKNLQVTLVGVLFLAWLVGIAYLVNERDFYHVAYENARAEVEAMARTKTGAITNAYRCYKRKR